MRFLKLTIAYDGENYVGWQFQPNGISVQQCLETAWKNVTDESIRFTASGRTDAGVHAEAQVCSVQTGTTLDNATLIRALNARTPFDIAVLNVETAPEGQASPPESQSGCEIGLFMKRARVATEWLGDYGYHAETIARLRGF